MREILFRAKGKLTNGWIYNDLFHYDKQDFVTADNRVTAIYPETVGQYTGLTDANGKKIFEGDICDFTAFRYDGRDKQLRGAVIYDGSRFVLTDSKEKDVLYDLDFILLNDDGFEVIGNIHDDPELLEVQK